MPGVVPSAQGGRRRPGAVGGVTSRSLRPGPEAPDREAAPGQRAAGQQPAPQRRSQARPAGHGEPATRANAFRAGQDIEVTIEDVAHGGWCVARPEGLPVIFVRHTLPGERVVARITEATAKFARADAVEIIDASPDRVTPPCPHARPGGCGGCDWQHAALRAQRALKAAVVAQQLKRLAGIDREVTVEPLPGDAPEITASSGPAAVSGPAAMMVDRQEAYRAPNDPLSSSDAARRKITATGGTPGLGWRTRVQFAVDGDGVAGLRGHRSHRVVDVGDCLIAHQAIRDLDIPGDDWSGASAVEVAVGGADSSGNFAVTVVEDGGQRRQSGRGKNKSRRDGGGRPARSKRTLVEGRPYLAEQAADRIWQVSAGGFWQVHPAAAGVLGQAVLEALAPEPGDTVLDLYCGAGLFAGVVAPVLGPDGAVTGIESDPAAVRDARQNLSDCPWARFHRADAAEAAASGSLPPARLVIADPPRSGLAREIVDYLVGAAGAGAAGHSAAERFAYVSCDPATLARDLALLAGGGWRLENLRAFDAFPMTHHVECVATLSR